MDSKNILRKKTWSAVLSDYEQLKEMLTEKYGEPSTSNEQFYKYSGNSNSIIMDLLKEGEYEWYSTFQTSLGEIELTLSQGTGYETGKVVLIYRDKTNSEKIRNAAMDDL